MTPPINTSCPFFWNAPAAPEGMYDTWNHVVTISHLIDNESLS